MASTSTAQPAIPGSIQPWPAPPSRPDRSATRQDRLAATTLAAVGVLSGWIAAGSVGLVSHGFRRGAVWLCLSAIAVAAWPSLESRWIGRLTGRHDLRPADRDRLSRLLYLGLIAALLVLVGLWLPSAHTAVHVLAIAFALAALAFTQQGRQRTALQWAAESLLLLGIYRLAYLNLPLVFLAADGVAAALARLASWLGARPLSAGPTLVGLDFLLVSSYLALRAARAEHPGDALEHRRFGRIALAWWAVAATHAIYLGLLSLADLWQSAPYRAPAEPLPLGVLPEATLIGGLREVIPWSMPALAALLHLIVLSWLLHRGLALADARRAAAAPPGGRAVYRTALAGALAVGMPLLCTWSSTQPTLLGKKIVLFEKGFLNWNKPEYNGEYGRIMAQGMYGMLPIVLESFGAEVVVSPELSPDDLRGAHAVVLLYPNKPWQPDQLNAAGEIAAPGQLAHLESYVRGGGSLLVMGEHSVRETDGGSRINEVLRMTNMQCAFDSVEMGVGGWLQSYHATAHPTTVGFADEGNDFGIVVGSAVETRWPAYPILIGRFGYSDPGDLRRESLMGDRLYGAGERLGDLALAAEQAVGRGRVIAIGDTSCLTNGLFTNAYVYVSRLMAYLTNQASSPLTPWRQSIGVVAAALLLGWVTVNRSLAAVVLVAGVAATSLALAVSATHRAWELLPDGRGRVPVATLTDRFDAHKVTRQSPPAGKDFQPNNLVYIDAAHLGHFSREMTRDDGLMGLVFHLVRSGYLPLMLHDFNAERLERAGMFVSVAPNRAFSRSERATIRDWVEAGGVMILLVGADRAAASRELLAEFNFSVGETPENLAAGREPRPLGHFKHQYFFDGEKAHYARFHAGWPVHCDHPNAFTVVNYWDDQTPVIRLRPAKLGLFVVIGDSDFAACKNLEREDGRPFEGEYENSDFWRYFLDMLKYRHDPDQEAKRWMPSAASATPRDRGDSTSAAEESAAEADDGAMTPASDAPPLDSPLPSLRRELLDSPPDGLDPGDAPPADDDSRAGAASDDGAAADKTAVAAAISAPSTEVA